MPRALKDSVNIMMHALDLGRSSSCAAAAILGGGRGGGVRMAGVASHPRSALHTAIMRALLGMESTKNSENCQFGVAKIVKFHCYVAC